MPFKSKAQRRFMHAAEARGDVPGGTAARWEAHTKDKHLPERVKKAGEQGMRSESFLQGFVDGLNKLAKLQWYTNGTRRPGVTEPPDEPKIKKLKAFKSLSSAAVPTPGGAVVTPHSGPVYPQ